MLLKGVATLYAVALVKFRKGRKSKIYEMGLRIYRTGGKEMSKHDWREIR